MFDCKHVTGRDKAKLEKMKKVPRQWVANLFLTTLAVVDLAAGISRIQQIAERMS